MHATHSSATVAKGSTPQTPATSTPSAALWRCALAAATAAMAGLLPGATVVALLLLCERPWLPPAQLLCEMLCLRCWLQGRRWERCCLLPGPPGCWLL